MQPADFVGVYGNSAISPAKLNVRMVALNFRYIADLLDEFLNHNGDQMIDDPRLQSISIAA